MRNSLSPGFIRIFYTSNGHQHVQTLPVIPVAPAGAATMLTDSSGAPQAWTAAIADIVLFEKSFFKAPSSLDSAELWTQALPTAVPILQDSIGIGVAGTSGSPEIPYEQIRFSFRGSGGSKGVFLLLETKWPIDTKESAPLYGGNVEQQAVESYLTGASCVIVTRAGEYMSSGIRSVTKINDALRKRYLNP